MSQDYNNEQEPLGQGAEQAKGAAKKTGKAAGKKVGKALGKIGMKAAKALLSLLAPILPWIIGGIVIIFLTMGAYNMLFESKPKNQEYQSEELSETNKYSKDRDGDGYNKIESLSAGNKLVKLFYTYHSDKSYYAVVDDNKKLHTANDEFLKKNKVKDKYDREKHFYLSPNVIFALDEYLNEGELRTPETFVKPVPYYYDEKSKEYRLKEIFDHKKEELSIQSTKWGKDGKRTEQKEVGVWDYGFASVLHYKKYIEEYKNLGYLTETQQWNVEAQKFETVPAEGNEVEAYEEKLPNKESYMIDQVVAPQGSIANEIEQKWANTGEAFTINQTRTKSVQIAKTRNVQGRDENGKKLYYEVENGQVSSGSASTNKTKYPVMVAEKYYVSENRDYTVKIEGHKWEYVPKYVGEPKEKHVTGTDYYVHYMENYVNYVPEDIMTEFDVKKRLELSDGEVRKLLFEDKSSEGGSSTPGNVDLTGLKIGSGGSEQSYKNAVRYIEYFKKYGNMYGVDPYILVAKAAQESSGNHFVPGTQTPIGTAAQGIMQIERLGTRTVTAYNQETKSNETFTATDGELSAIETNIKWGTMYFANNAKDADFELLVALQAYNYGGGFIGYAKQHNGGKWSQEIANSASDYFAAQQGWSSYGDKKYIEHVLRYYASPDDKQPWVMDDKGTKKTLDGSSISLGSVDSVNGGTLVQNGSTLWKSFVSAVSSMWEANKKDVAKLFGIDDLEENRSDFTSTKPRVKVKKKMDRMESATLIKSMMAFEDGKPLSHYNEFSEKDFKQRFMSMFVNPLGNKKEIEAEKKKKDTTEYFPKGFEPPVKDPKIITPFGFSEKKGDDGKPLKDSKGEKEYNRVIEIGVTQGQEIVSVSDGKVISVTKHGSKEIIIQVVQGIKVRYSNVGTILVKEGQTVKKGTPIAKGSANVDGKNSFMMGLVKDEKYIDPTFITGKEDKESGGVDGGAESKDAAGLIAYAKKFLGIPYVWGGTDPKTGLDCSGFTLLVFREMGINIDRVTTQQEQHGKDVSLDSLAPGDLIYWGPRGASYHVAIYIGNGEYIHAPTPGDVIKITKISDWKPDFAKRVLK